MVGQVRGFNMVDAKARLPWFRRIDAWECATGLFVFAVMLWGAYFGDGVRNYAQNLLAITIISEFFMAWAGVGAVVASACDRRIERVLCLLGGVALYAVCVVRVFKGDDAHYMFAQSLWVLGMRFRLRRGMTWFGTEHLRKVGVGIVVGCIVVFAQLVLQSIVVSAVELLGVEMRIVDNATVAPRWVYALVWGLFYVELGYLRPLFEKLAWKEDEPRTQPDEILPSSWQVDRDSDP